MNLARRSLQIELNNFVQILTLPFISKQAFSAARKKLSADCFKDLNHTLIHEYYNDNKLKTFLGFRILAVDGVVLQLPDSAAIREKYGVSTNHKETHSMAMARASCVYDPLSGLTLDAIMSPYAVSERTMMYEHILNVPSCDTANDLYILDRGYPSIALICFLTAHKKDFIIRCGTSWLSEVNNVLYSGVKDAIIEISPQMLQGRQKKDFKKLFPGISRKKRIKLRVVVITLPSGEKEVLITSLLDKTKYAYEIFKGLYVTRWGAEENYKFHKVRIEIENFSGESPQAIEQDFHATILTANIRTLIAEEAQEELDQIHAAKEIKHDYKINKNISAGILKDEIVEAIVNPKKDLKAFCERLKCNMRKSVIPIRLGRKYMRIRKSARKYPMNRRRAL